MQEGADVIGLERLIELSVVCPEGEVRTYCRKITKIGAVCIARIGGAAGPTACKCRAGSSSDQEIRETWKSRLPDLYAWEIGSHVIAAKFHACSETVFAMCPG